MIHKDKLNLSSGKLKFLSTLAVSGIIMLVVFLLSGTVMQRALKYSEKNYLENCSQVLQGYSAAIQYYLENYHTSLSSIYDSEMFARGNPEEIQKWIIQNMKYMNEDFSSVFYVDSNLTGYFSQGWVTDLKFKPYAVRENFTGEKYYISDIYYSDHFKDLVFFIEHPYFNSEHILKGILCAEIRVNKLAKISQKIKIGDNSTVYIFDRQGKLLDHVDPELIGKVFVPKSEKYKAITSDVTAREGNGHVETENHLGEPIDLFYSKIKNCGWTISVGFPKKYLHAVYNKYNSIKILVLLISIVALILLLFVETFVSDYFYKNQLIEPVYDPLTKLWTRQKFESEANKILRKNPKSRFMLINGDIRGFKFINQSYGVLEADKMVFFYSTILNKAAMEYKAIIAHDYADQFCALVKVQDLRDAINTFKGLLYLFTEQISEYEIPFFPKFGITFCKPSHTPGITVQKLMGQASFAKSTIKENMLLPYSIYNSVLLGKINEEQTIEHNMKSALENQEFFIMYQPKIMLEDDSLVGAEALVRWQSPLMGLVYPDKFIPLFERNGFVVKLDFYVYDKVFSFLDSQIKAGRPVVPISVNMSRNHNHPSKFMAEFMRIFKKYSIPPSLIQVEIIERSVMDRETLCEITNALHDEGFTVAMDDFGSGESSLNMLTQIPVDVLKFDREFLLSSVDENDRIKDKSATFIQSLIDLSRNLDKKTVFEGVETESQRDFLRSINCDQVQGYLYSKPLTEKDFVAFIDAHLSVCPGV
ncbi:GGDEF domain-containing protein [Treponema sp.]|uniref:GGDEF domain-containing protein n=2 Tax=Treponema TaxID=157 RepID=UPI0025F160A5|nr:GGDEF domain-containing protein [Treponema sp.]MBR4323829.1 GGDEF domain-containing protein [Treponema sp.]